MSLQNLQIPWALLFAAAICFAGSTAMAQGTADSSDKPTLRVLTYNIHHGEARDGKFDYQRLAATIARLKPDVVALQEVDNKTRRAKGVDQAAELGKRLNMQHVFGNALYYSGGQYGEAILSRFPLTDVKAHHLPYSFGNEPRTALEVTVQPGNGLPDFVIVGTHLCHESAATRQQQTQALHALFASRTDYPVILAGDLNARPASAAMKVLLGKGWQDILAPHSKIDYLLLRSTDPWKTIKIEIIDEPVVSDHDPVLAVLQWDG